MSDPITSLKSVVMLMEAALEHAPPTTRKILQDSVNVHLDVLAAALQPKPAEPPKP
jgi:hypothetical protein